MTSRQNPARRVARRAKQPTTTWLTVFEAWPWPVQALVCLAAIGAIAQAPDPVALVIRVVRELLRVG